MDAKMVQKNGNGANLLKNNVKDQALRAKLFQKAMPVPHF
jgi:hypothetical protein